MSAASDNRDNSEVEEELVVPPPAKRRRQLPVMKTVMHQLQEEEQREQEQQEREREQAWLEQEPDRRKQRQGLVTHEIQWVMQHMRNIQVIQQELCMRSLQVEKELS